MLIITGNKLIKEDASFNFKATLGAQKLVV